MEQNKKSRLESGLLSERFPRVRTILIRMTYYQEGFNPVLMLRTVHMLPKDPAYFNMECIIKGCENGGFDLTRIVAGMVKENKKVARGRLRCNGKADSLTSTHAHVDYEIGIEYTRAAGRSKK